MERKNINRIGTTVNKPWEVFAQNFSGFESRKIYIGVLNDGSVSFYIGYKYSDDVFMGIIIGYGNNFKRVMYANNKWTYSTPTLTDHDFSV